MGFGWDLGPQAWWIEIAYIDCLSKLNRGEPAFCFRLNTVESTAHDCSQKQFSKAFRYEINHANRLQIEGHLIRPSAVLM